MYVKEKTLQKHENLFSMSMCKLAYTEERLSFKSSKTPRYDKKPILQIYMLLTARI